MNIETLNRSRRKELTVKVDPEEPTNAVLWG
jgi:hypothetical protein